MICGFRTDDGRDLSATIEIDVRDQGSFWRLKSASGDNVHSKFANLPEQAKGNYALLATLVFLT